MPVTPLTDLVYYEAIVLDNKIISGTAGNLSKEVAQLEKRYNDLVDLVGEIIATLVVNTERKSLAISENEELWVEWLEKWQKRRDTITK